MSDLVAEHSFGSNDLVEDALADMRVESGQRIVQHVNVSVGVYRSGEADALLLAAGQVDALLADFGRVACRHQLQVARERTRAYHLFVETLVDAGVRTLSEQDVVAHGRVLDPRLLRHICSRAAHLQSSVAIVVQLAIQRLHIAKHGRQQTRLAAAHFAHKLTTPYIMNALQKLFVFFIFIYILAIS